MFVRFIIQKKDSDSGKRQGLFQVMYILRRSGVLLPQEELLFNEINEWFQKNLKKPISFSRSAKPHAKKIALSWFKDQAKEHIDKMRALSIILNSHGITTEMIKTDRPGYITYEDEYQIAAEPFYDTDT
jgi:hypothetical protein